MSGPLLQLTRVAKSFGAVQALREVSFDLRPGEVHALLGENGAGKSTLIKIISGAHGPDSGTIDIAGLRIRRLTPSGARKLGIACIYQQPALCRDLTVAENIALRLRSLRPLARVDRRAQRRQAARLLERLGAALCPDAEVRALSMPQQQLVEIACALGANARIFVLDEPTASLTQPEAELLFNIVRNLRAAGAGLVYISHRLEEIFGLADRVTVLRDGQSVGTFDIGPRPTCTEGELIRLMVGREVERMYPLREPAPSPQGFGLRQSSGAFSSPGSNERQRTGAVQNAPRPGTPVLSLRNLCCAAGGVRGVSLDVGAGEVTALAGLVGAGRTELARVLFGLTPADAGRILFEGRPVTIASPRQAMAVGIAYLPEDRRRHGLVLDLSIAANISMAVHRRLFPRGWLRLGAERALALDFMRALAIKAPGSEAAASSLSGGNQQKVALARWLAATPRLLILDEPTQGVDVAAKSEIHKLIRRLAAQGLAILMISSDLPEVLGMGQRIIVMRGGTVAARLPGGSPAHVVMAAALGQNSET